MDNIEIHFYDLGVHTGEEIKYFLDMTKEMKNTDLYVYGFEANTIFYNKVKEKYKNKANFNFYNVAISKENKKLKLYIDTSTASEGSSIYKDKKNVSTTFIEVDGIKFTDFIENKEKKNNHINIIKANIEGAEFDLVMDLSEKNRFNFFDLYLGAEGWCADLKKIPTMVSKIDIVKKILKDNGVSIFPFLGGYSKSLDVKQKILSIIKGNVHD